MPVFPTGAETSFQGRARNVGGTARWERNVEFIQFIAGALDHIIRAAIKLFSSAMTILEAALRGPLQTVGIHGALQTLILTVIPILTIVVVVKLFGGIIRAIVVLILVMMLIHIMLPFFSGGVVHAP